jgi:hypothetical protein
VTDGGGNILESERGLSMAQFIWLIIRLIQLVFLAGTVFFSHKKSANSRPVRLDLSAQSAAIKQCFSLTTNQRTVLSAQ